MTEPLRVIQWTTGNIGRRSLHAIIGRPDLELVGVYAHGADKVGQDAAELCGWPEPTGVLATNDIDALVALRPDACCYNPLWPSIDELVRLLEAGINVCTSAAWITGGKQTAEDRARIEKACEQGRSHDLRQRCAPRHHQHGRAWCSPAPARSSTRSRSPSRSTARRTSRPRRRPRWASRRRRTPPGSPRAYAARARSSPSRPR